jgi:hypothetical protein
MPESRTPVPENLRPKSELATERQVAYLNGLRDGKVLDNLLPEQIAWLRDADFTTVSKAKASDIIEELRSLPWAPRDAAFGVFPEIKDGRYAIPKDDGTLMFYSIKRGNSVIFVDVWASDARWPVKSSEERARILEAIKNDPDAGPRFGREIGRCYVCGRTLTDETSRALGIGPVCRGDE